MYVKITMPHAGKGKSRFKGQEVDVSDAEGKSLIDCGFAVLAMTPTAVALQTLMQYRCGITYPVAGGEDVAKIVAQAEDLGMDAKPQDAPKTKGKAKAKPRPADTAE